MLLHSAALEGFVVHGYKNNFDEGQRQFLWQASPNMRPERLFKDNFGGEKSSQGQFLWHPTINQGFLKIRNQDKLKKAIFPRNNNLSQT